MKARWRHPVRSLGWYNAAKKVFDELPEDAPGQPAKTL